MLTRVKTFDDGRCVDEISPAQHAHEVRVELGDLYPGRPMHFVREQNEEEQGEEDEEEEATTMTKKYNLRKKRKEKTKREAKELQYALTVAELRTFLVALRTAQHLRKVKERKTRRGAAV